MTATAGAISMGIYPSGENQLKVSIARHRMDTGGVRRLHLNEFRFEHAPGVVAALQEVAGRITSMDLAHGPDASDGNLLTADIAQYVDAPRAASILLTSGSADVWRAVVDMSVTLGHDCAILGTPGPIIFERLAHQKPLRTIRYAIGLGTNSADHAASLRYYTDELHAGCLVYLGSPNDPTGDLWPANTVAGFAAAYPRSLFFVDEEYIEFAGGGEPPHGGITEADASRQLNANSCVQIALAFDNVVVSRTFSRAFGLAALGLGYVVGQPQTIIALGAMASPKAFSPVFDIARAALRAPGHYLNAARVARGGMRWTAMELRKLGWWALDTPANFYLVFVGSGDATSCVATLRNERISVGNLDSMPSMAGFVRITAGTPNDNQAVLVAFDRQQPPTDIVPVQALYTNKGHVAAMKVLMRRTLSTLADAGIAVWAEDQTILGVLHHKGMAPTDISASLAYMSEAGEVDPMVLAQPRLLAAGLTLRRTDDHWRIDTCGTGSDTHIDLFSYQLQVMPGVGPCFVGSEFHVGHMYPPEELFPLLPGTFYDMTVMVPIRADRVVERMRDQTPA